MANLFSITLPLLKPIIFIALVYRTIFALRALARMDLTGGGPFGKNRYNVHLSFLSWLCVLDSSVWQPQLRR